MSSHRPRSYSRPLHRRKSHWKRKVFLILVLLVGGWYVSPYLWKKGKSLFSSKVVVQESQKEAMDKLKALSSSWKLKDEDLKVFADDYPQNIDWMQSEEAKDSATLLLAQELELRGMHGQSRPMVTELLEKRMKSSGELSEEQKKALIAEAVEWGDRFAASGADYYAEKLFSSALSMAVKDESSIGLLLKAIDLRNSKGNIDGVLELTGKLHEDTVLDELKSPELVREVVDHLFLEDALKSKKTGQLSSEGESLAFILLEKYGLDASPEMGRIKLSKLRDRLSGNVQGQAAELRKELEDILVCFRASEEDMAYIPETMLAIARLYMQEGNMPYTLLWADRASGSAMTLGVDTPRVIGEGSLKDEIVALKEKCKEELKAKSLFRNAEDNIRKTRLLIASSAWTDAKARAEANLEMLKGTKFADGLIPVTAYQLALSRMGQSNWEGACALLESLKTEWAQLTDEDLSLMDQRLKANGYPDLYKDIHRKLAEAYLKRDMKTMATETLSVIGESLPKETSESARSSSRRTR